MTSLQPDTSRDAAGGLCLSGPIVAGDSAAFEWVFRRFSAELHRFAYRLGGSHVVANDVVQEAFAEAWRLARTWESASALRAFLYCVARTRTLMQRRHARVVQRLASRAAGTLYPDGDLAPPVHDGVEQDELCDAVQAAVNALPTKTRQVILMSRFSGLTYREIAHRLGLSVKTVEWHMDRAFTLLRNPLARHWPISVLVLAALYGTRHPG